MLTKTDLLNVIREQKLAGKVISLHSAYGSFGGIEDGPGTLIDAFIESGCTLLVPTFTYMNDAYPPLAGKKYAQNGVDLNAYQDALNDLTDSFKKGSQQISKEMGIIPKLILARPEAKRGNHPVNSLTAIGPRAVQLVEKQSCLDVYAPFEQCLKEQDAVLLLMGVDFTGTTPIHFAEKLAGRTLFRAWANVIENEIKQVKEVEIGSCSNGFNQLQTASQAIKTGTKVGNSNWQFYPFNRFIETCSNVIRQQPAITQCNNNNCIRCQDAIAGGPIIPH